MLFIMEPKRYGWTVEIVPNTRQARILKKYVQEMVARSGYEDVVIK